MINRPRRLLRPSTRELQHQQPELTAVHHSVRHSHREKQTNKPKQKKKKTAQKINKRLIDYR